MMGFIRGVWGDYLRDSLPTSYIYIYTTVETFNRFLIYLSMIYIYSIYFGAPQCK